MCCTILQLCLGLLEQVSILPFDLVGLLVDSSSVSQLKVLRIVRLLRLVKLVRMLKGSRCVFFRAQRAPA